MFLGFIFKVYKKSPAEQCSTALLDHWAVWSLKPCLWSLHSFALNPVQLHLAVSALHCLALHRVALGCLALYCNILHSTALHYRRSAVTACPRFMDNSRQGSRFHGAPNPIFLTITCRLIQSRVQIPIRLKLASKDRQGLDRYGGDNVDQNLSHPMCNAVQGSLHFRQATIVPHRYLSESRHNWCQ